MWYARAYILVSCFYACVHAATAFCTHCTVHVCASAYVYLCLCVLISVRVGPGRRMKLEDAQNVVISLKGAMYIVILEHSKRKYGRGFS